MRELKTVTTVTGTTSTRSVYSGAEIAMELDSDGTRYTYLWGPGRLPLSVTRERTGEASETFAYQVDAMGSVIGMTDESGTVVARYSYDPWGRVTDEMAIGDDIAYRNPLRYRAYYQDAETGLYYMPARFYDPTTYRFLSADPAPPSAGDPGSLNAFVYCGNDPIGATDPSGARADLDGDGKVSAEEHKILNVRDKMAADKARTARELDRAARLGMDLARVPRFRIVDTPVFPEFLGINHVYVDDTQSGWLKGMNGRNGKDYAWLGLTGGGPVHASRPVFLPAGMTPEEFIERIEGWDGWNDGEWKYRQNDCHNQLQSAFKEAGVPYPGSPYGRTDWDNRWDSLSD